MTKLRYGTIVPLIGGMTVANKQVVGQEPDLFLSYTPFASNEESAKAYFPTTPHFNLDDPESVKGFDIEKYRNIDFMSAVCPCAGLSMLSRGKPEQKAAMNQWMIKATEFMTGTLRPKVYWGENAPALATAAGKEVRDQLREIGRKNGYSMTVYATNTALHGIPQIRKRSFYFFWRDTNAPILEYYDKPKKNLGDYLAEIPAAANPQSDITLSQLQLHGDPYYRYLYCIGEGLSGVRLWLDEHNINTITLSRYIQISGKIDDACKFFSESDEIDMQRAGKELRRIKEKTDAGKGVWDGSISIFNPKMEFLALVHRKLDSIHPVEDRIITIRECLHLMGLPHDFKLTTGVLNHICQNVPVCTAADMTREVVAYLKGDREISTANFMMQNNNSRQVAHQESSFLTF